jgi:hypothetical protein
LVRRSEHKSLYSQSQALWHGALIDRDSQNSLPNGTRRFVDLTCVATQELAARRNHGGHFISRIDMDCCQYLAP